ncbi:MAG: DMT family transporter [Bacteroidales bacterium]|nr:DMT family transporter [Bacteroidales bacterium]
MTNQKKAYIFALLAVLFWSTVSTGFKLALEVIDYVQLLFISTFVATIITFVTLLFTNKLKLVLKSSSKEIGKSALVAVLNPFGYYMVLLKAYSILPAQIAQPLNYTWPVVLVLLSAPFLKQKIKKQSIIALLVSFSGVMIIATQGNLSTLKIDQPFGVFLAAFSSVIWALFWLLNVKDKRDEVVKLFLNFLFALVYEAIAIFFISDFNFKIDISLAPAVYVGFFELGITFIIWLKAMKLTTSNDKISNLIFLSPALALIFIRFILGEEIFYTTYIGLFFILLGIFILNKKKKKQQL